MTQGAPVTNLVTKISRSPFNQVLLSTARVRVVGPNGLIVQARALIDQCSQVSVVSRSLCQRLRLKIEPAHIPICGIGSETTAVSSESVSFTIIPRFESTFSCTVQALVLPRISSYSPPSIRSSCELSHIKGLNLADPNFMDQESEPIATLSLLGWLLSGNVLEEVSDFDSPLVSLHCAEPPALDESLQRFWHMKSCLLKISTPQQSRSAKIISSPRTVETQVGGTLYVCPLKDLPRKLTH